MSNPPTEGMTTEEYSQHLYDRAARRYGYADHEAWRAAGVDPVAAERLSKRAAKEAADAQKWTAAQLRD